MPSPYDANASLVLTFRGRLELALEPPPPGYPQPPNPPGSVPPPSGSPEVALQQATHRLVRELAGESGAIGHDIEEELQRLAPPGVAILAQVSISEGSLVIAGVITFLHWAAASEVVSGAFAEMVKRITGFAIDRVLERYVRNRGGNLRAHGPLRIEYQSIDQIATGTAPAAEPRPPWLQRSAMWLLLGFDSAALALILIAELLRSPRLF